MRTSTFIIISFCACLVLALLFYPSFKHIEKRSRSSDLVLATVPYGINFVSATIHRAWPSEIPRAGLPYPWDRFIPFAMPTDFQLSSGVRLNPGLKRYLTFNPSARVQDIYLYDPLVGDYFWPSEYFYRSRPAPFHTDFIIHLASQGLGQTQIELFEALPFIWVGNSFGWSAHSGPIPMWTRDIRWVSQTSQDRVELLSVMKDLLSGQLPSQIPPYVIQTQTLRK